MCIILLQILLTTATFLSFPIGAKLYMPVLTSPRVELYCHVDLVSLLTPLIYNLVILLLCAVHGFLTRKHPENFNESWHIFISVSTTSFVWAVFLPAYFTAFYAYNQVSRHWHVQLWLRYHLHWSELKFMYTQMFFAIVT